MGTDRFKLNRWLRAALLLVLLTSQAFVAAHEVDHWSGEGEVCSVCSIGQPLDGAVSVATVVIGVPATDACPAPATATHAPHRSAAPYHGRAPPLPSRS